ncbi:transcriptional regulator MntR, partial [Xanthomonas perforans]|nr:transcriptional regulator MntR [Xanthomonas perforans]
HHVSEATVAAFAAFLDRQGGAAT